MVSTISKRELVINKPESSKENDEGDPNARDTWGNQCEFFLSCLGFAVGFGNVWRFPFLAFKNGGAVFLIPYFTMLIIAGLPMFFMELALGQYVSLGPNILFPELSPIFSGVGWAMLATTAMVAIYYNMVFAWSLFYTFASFTTELPWSSCNNTFNTDGCFTYEESLECKKEGLFFFNKSCVSIESFCSISLMESHNSTHCIFGGNVSSINVAEKAVSRISASEDFYKNRMLGVSGTTWENIGGLRWELVGCLALAWIIICACMIKGVKSSGKVVYFSAIFPYVVLVILFIRGITLEGAMKGIEFYIMKPDFSKLRDIQVWNDAATQIFYSLSTAFGGLITLSSYNKFKNNCMRDAIIISFANCATSVFAGFVIFSILGFMANEIQVEVKDVVDSGSGLAFIAYPAAVARMPYPPIWSVLFFTMLITLGIDSQFTFVETISTGIFDRFEHLREKKEIVMMTLCVVMFLLGLPLCLDGGVYMFELINYYSAGLSVLFIAICEVVCVVYVYGFRKFMHNITVDMGINVPAPLYCYWASTWLFLTPVSLILILGFGLYYFELGRWGSYIYPQNIQTLGWCTTVFSMVAIPVYAFYVVFFSSKQGMKMINSTEKFCPANIRRKNEQTSQTQAFSYIYDNDGFIDGHLQTYPPSYSTKGTLENDASINGALGNGALGNGALGNGALGNGALRNGALGNGALGNGTSANGTMNLSEPYAGNNCTISPKENTVPYLPSIEDSISNSLSNRNNYPPDYSISI